MIVKTYSELCSFNTFEERFRYLILNGSVGAETFGGDRYLNQSFYNSRPWRLFRRDIIIRDQGCDLAFPNREIFGKIIVHHLNPLTIEDIEFGRFCLFDPENVACVSHNTSNAIHYGNEDYLFKIPAKRIRGDTTLW